MSQRYPYEQYRSEVDELLKKGYGRDAIYHWLAEQTGKSYNAVKKSICKQGFDNVFRGLQTANREWVNHPSYKDWNPSVRDSRTVANNETLPFRKMSDYPTSRKDYVVSSKIEHTEPIKSTNGSTQTEYKEKRNNDGSIEITDIIDRKLTDAELFERYGRSQDDWRISMVWFKDRRDGFLLSCCFIPLVKEQAQNQFRENLIREVKSISPYVPLKSHSKTQNGKLLEIDIFDPHFGKLAWGKETGDDYDIVIAEERYMTALSSLLQKASSFERIDKILFPIGNDLMHTDTVNKTTTAGTPQDVDTRWQKMWLKTRMAVMKGIAMATEVAPVDIVIVPSNHDFQSIFYLGDLLECYYENNKNITVDNQPKTRKYYRWGKSGIGFTHGNEENIKELPMIMLRENQKDWSHVEYMEWHIGHWHKKKQLQFVSVDDHKGISVRFLRSLSGSDAWHYIKGYIGAIKGAESFIWDKEYGITANFMHNL